VDHGPDIPPVLHGVLVTLRPAAPDDLPALLDILDERAAQIDERIAQLVALKKEIREYQQRLRNKVLQDATQEEPGTTGKEMRT